MSKNDFFQRVYSVVKTIPEGRVTTYGLIAKKLGTAKSSRTVGWALNACHNDSSIPAHRVVNRNGLLKDIAKVFFQNKVSISSARINTLGERVEDSFEICTYEKNLVSSRRINKIEKALKKIL